MTQSTTHDNSGIGFCGLLTIVLITLKLTGHITWSWLWVLAPLWGPLAFVGFLTVVTVAALCVARGRR